MKDLSGQGNIAKVNDLEIYYELFNGQELQSHKLLLILLHDGLGSTKQWKDIPGILSSKLNIPTVTYDRLGYGKSSTVEKRSNTFLNYEAECVLPLLLKHLDYDGKVILFGHSDGATVALLYAALYPGKAKMVIAEAPHVIIEPETISGVKKTIQDYKEGSLKERLEKYHSSQTDNMFWGWANFWSNKSSRSWNMLSLLSRIESPVYYIQGDKDEFGTRKQGEEIEINIMGDFDELIVENCGHVPHFEAKQEVLSAIVDYIKK